MAKKETVKIININHDKDYITIHFSEDKRSVNHYIHIDGDGIRYIQGEMGGISLKHLRMIMNKKEVFPDIMKAHTKMINDFENKLNEVKDG